jgi:asparagine synthase (glutamine-hydrolysing)
MCGIFALFNNDNYFTKDFINKQFEKGKTRGPENSCLIENVHSIIGFHRLAINGLNSTSNQPLVIDNIMLICNGEIYNYKELYSLMNITGSTQSDCEIIIHLYIKFGIEQTLRLLDGVFAFILLDNRITNDDLTCKCYVARDPFGVRPLYLLRSTSQQKNIFGFASELKVLSEFYHTLFDTNYSITPFTPGTYSSFRLSDKVLSIWKNENENIPYFIPHFPNTLLNNSFTNDYMFKLMDDISSSLNNAVIKRCLNTERPVAALLSGGLDSSLIAALVSNYYKDTIGKNILETYSIGLFGSEDLKHAKIVAEYIGSNHTEIIVTEQEMFDAIPDVIYAIESYDITTIRASIGNYLVGKYISQNSDAKVIFNGDGADELCGGYLYMSKCPNSIEFDKETRRLLNDIHFFDVLRSDRCISCHGLEPRTPFLDKSFVNNYLSIPIFIRSSEFLNIQEMNVIEKYLLRNSFSSFTCKFLDKQILPDNILWRKKEAFSDGVSTFKRSLYQILQEFISNKLENNNDVYNLTPLEKEKYYYKSIFEKYYKGLENVIPYYWMPKYIHSLDPSARTLDNYETKSNIIEEK